MTEPHDAEVRGPVLPSRGGAWGCGIGCGAFALLALMIAAGIAVDKAGFDRGNLPWTLLIGGALVAFAGVAIRDKARDEDRVNLACLGAPPLPVSLLEDGSRVFVRGRVVCPEPVIAPWWDEPCAFVHVVETKGSGKHKKTLRDEKFAARTWIDDGSLGDLAGGTAGLPEIDFSKAKFVRIEKWSGSTGGTDVAISFVRAGDTVSVAGRFRAAASPPSARGAVPVPGDSGAPGRKSESKVDVDFDLSKPAEKSAGGGAAGRIVVHGADDPRPAIGPDDSAPLVVTPMDRRSFAVHGETEEAQSRFAGTAGVLVGSAAIGAALARFVVDVRLDGPGAALGCAAGVALALLFLVARELRRIRECRARAAEAHAALAAEMDRAERAASDVRSAADPEAAARLADAAETRVTARLAVYEQLAAEHDDAIAHFPMSVAARLAGHRPLLRKAR